MDRFELVQAIAIPTPLNERLHLYLISTGVLMDRYLWQ